RPADASGYQQEAPGRRRSGGARGMRSQARGAPGSGRGRSGSRAARGARPPARPPCPPDAGASTPPASRPPRGRRAAAPTSRRTGRGRAATAAPAAGSPAPAGRRPERRGRLFSLGSREPCTLAHRLSPLRKKLHYDVAIVGAGVAGLTAALTAADAGASVVVLAKGAVDSSNSWAAQGGVAAAIGPDDDPSLHAADTLAAGRGLCRESAVELLTREAP